MLIAQLVRIYSLIIFGRILLSWFPVSRGGAMESIYNVLYQLTEPLLGPVRRALPPLGGFDLSPIVVIFGLQILAGAFSR